MWLAPFKEMTGSPFQFYHRAQDAWDAVAEACDRATISVDFEQYILGDDTPGQGILDVLTRRARAGVRVRVLLDAIGSRRARQKHQAAPLQEAGGQVRFYNPITLGSLLRIPPRIHRNHRKTVIIDNRTLFVGGVCFQERMREWRDSMVRLDDPVAEAAVEPFESAWKRAGGEAEPASGTYRQQSGPYRYIVNSAEPPVSRDLQEEVLARLALARHTVRLTTPYLVPDHDLLECLLAVRRRGVRLLILLPEVSDARTIDPLNRLYAARLMRAGADVLFYQGRLLHAKLATVDDTWGHVSSLNLDRLSSRLNLENAVTSADPAFVGALNEQFERDLRTSRREVPGTLPQLVGWVFRGAFTR